MWSRAVTDFRLRLWPDPILSQRCDPIRPMRHASVAELPEFHEAIGVMLQTVEKYEALGIAANQVGWDRRVIVARIAGALHVMVNPEIDERSGARRADEACLSVPGVVVPVTRHDWITVAYHDADHPYDWHCCELSGLEAAIVQHEIDHLNGKTLADHPHARRTLQNREALAKLKAARA